MRRRLTTFWQALALISLLVIPFSVPLTHAQATDPGALNLTTSPLPINLTAKPGETVNTELRVKNSGTKDEVLKVGLMKFTAYGEEGKPQLKDREPGDDYFDWVSFSQNQFVAQPNEWKSIIMTIKVPKDAAFGYYYAVTFTRADPKAPPSSDASAVHGGTAILVLLEAISPNAKRELKLTGFSTSKSIYEFLPANFTIKLQNTGNIHVVPSGTIFIRKGNKQIDTIPFNSSRGNILPGSSRIFTAEWDNGFPAYQAKELNGDVVLKNGKPVHELSWKVTNIKNLRFGRYTAHLTAVYDNGQRDVPLDASVSFWVIPWRLVAIFIGIPLVIIAIIVYLFVSRRRYKKKATATTKMKK